MFNSDEGVNYILSYAKTLVDNLNVGKVVPRELKNIHLMNQQDKREALSDFRQNRSEVQGKKIG